MDEIFSKVAEAIPSWLEYQVHCGRQMLLGESYLAQPIGEVLRVEHRGDVRAEFNHPIITSPSRGRPRQIDYVLCGREPGKLVAGLEVKWVDNAAASKQRLVDDLLRVECLKASPEDRQSAARYFLVAGAIGHIENNFINLVSNSGGGRERFLPYLLDQKSDQALEVRVLKDPLIFHVKFDV